MPVLQIIPRATVAEAQIERFYAVDCLEASAALSGVPRAILRMVLVGASTEWTLDHFMEWNQNPDPDLSAFFIDCLSVFLADGAMESHRWEASACR